MYIVSTLYMMYTVYIVLCWLTFPGYYGEHYVMPLYNAMLSRYVNYR